MFVSTYVHQLTYDLFGSFVASWQVGYSPESMFGIYSQKDKIRVIQITTFGIKQIHPRPDEHGRTTHHSIETDMTHLNHPPENYGVPAV